MTDITKLPDRWRDAAERVNLRGQIFDTCATELSAALPVWTKITDNPETWPPSDKRVFSFHERLSYGPHTYHQTKVGPSFEFTHWRHMCSLDRPPS